MYAQKLLPAFAVLSVVAAQSASICSQATATINAQADVAQYTSCSTIKGDVLIAPGAAGVISFDGPDRIDGNLIANNAGALTSFGSASLQEITGSFTLFNLTLLSTLSMAQLTAVGNIAWTALPALSQLSFTQDVKKANKVIITNTFLSSLNGINLDTVQVLDINNNNRLKEFSTQVGNITQSLNIDANGRNLDVSFPNLISAANMTFRNVSSVSIPSLVRVNGSLGFYGNYFDSLKAPNLTFVGSSIAFVANPNLQNITLPLLKSIGGANQIANNSALTDISFPVLQTVSGAIDFSGNFSTPSLPGLVDIKGGFNMQSTAQIDCSNFESLQKSGVIQGTFTCKTTADAKSGVGSGSGTSSSGGSSPTSSHNAAVSYGANTAVAGLSVVGGLLGMLL